ncbi:MAG TPA: MBL fold metallo-hydrolase [Bryobacteraceae bacterium]|nr:MBL fold metallo-hydrolase [Bryobacteraceae bacterium]
MTSVAIGDFRVTLVREAHHWWDGGVLFGVVPKTLWARRTAADELNRIRLGFNCYVVETGDRTILIETGAGDKPDARARERMNLAPDARPIHEVLAAAGFEPQRIDVVINSHLHWDHCGGNTTLTSGGPVPAFPNATYYTPRGEWEHAHLRHPRDSVSYDGRNYDALEASGRMCLVGPVHEPAPGIRMINAPGHNRHMAIVTAESRGRTFCFFSDLVPTSIHLTPTWVAAFDLYPLESIDTKLHWLGQAARDGWICGFGHDPEIAFARVESHKAGFITAGEIR